MTAKILIVDDEVELAAALMEGLARRSYQARSYTNGSAALAALREEHFDLLISDLMMPEMDGITLVKEALKIDSQLVAILMTGQATIHTAEEAIVVGTFDYLLKPLRMQTLLPIVRRALDSQRLRKEHPLFQETTSDKRHTQPASEGDSLSPATLLYREEADECPPGVYPNH